MVPFANGWEPSLAIDKIQTIQKQNKNEMVAKHKASIDH